MNEVLPCPFCGRDPIRSIDPDAIAVHCKNHTGWMKIGEWNKRARPNEPLPIDRLRARWPHVLKRAKEMGVEDPVGELEKILDSIPPSHPDSDAELARAREILGAVEELMYDNEIDSLVMTLPSRAVRQNWMITRIQVRAVAATDAARKEGGA